MTYSTVLNFLLFEYFNLFEYMAGAGKTFLMLFYFRAVAVKFRNSCRLKSFISGDLVTFFYKLKNSDLADYCSAISFSYLQYHLFLVQYDAILYLVVQL